MHNKKEKEQIENRCHMFCLSVSLPYPKAAAHEPLMVNMVLALSQSTHLTVMVILVES